VTRDFESSPDDWAISRPIYDSEDPRNSSAKIFALRDKASQFALIENSKCMELFSDPLSATAELLLVTNETSLSHNGTSLFGGWLNGAHSQRWEASNGWICAGHNGTPWTRYCSLSWALEFHDSWNFSTAFAGSFQNDWDKIVGREPTDQTVYVTHCLVGERADLQTRCGLHYNFYLLVLIIVVTAADTLLICFVAAAHNEPTLVVLGDAVAEALETRKDDRSTTTSSKFLAVNRWPDEPCPRWFAAISLRTWIISLSLYVETFDSVRLLY